MPYHVATAVLVNVDATGTVRPNKSGTINQIAQSNIERRILPDSAIPNSSGYPTIVDYLNAEESSGFDLVHMDQYMVITKSNP